MTAGQIRLPLVYMAVMGAGRSAGAQHSDVPYPMLMNLGGVKVVVPSTPADAKGLLKAAIRDDNPVVFLQPARRGGEQGEVPDGEHLVPLGSADVKRTGTDVTVVAIGAMVRHALRAAELLAKRGHQRRSRSIRARCFRWTKSRSCARCARPAGWSWSTRRARPAALPARSQRSPSRKRSTPASAGAARHRAAMWRFPTAPALEKAVLPDETQSRLRCAKSCTRRADRMKLSLKLPMFGMNMEQATIVKWHSQPGESFNKGEPLYEIETEKVTTEVEAPCDGTLVEIVAPPEAIVTVGAIVCHIDS